MSELLIGHAPLQGGGAFTVNLLLSQLNTKNMFFTLTVDYVDCCNLSPILSGSTHEHYHEFMQVHHVCPCSFLCKFLFPAFPATPKYQTQHFPCSLY